MPERDDFDYYDDYEDDCWNCGGDGFVYGCSWDWQCDTYDEGEGACLCTRRCDVCNPAPRNLELERVLAEALAAVPQCRKPGCTKPRGSVCTYSLCHGRGYGAHLYAAQAIEARRAETGTGSVADESAVAKPCAPNTSTKENAHGNR